MSSLPRISIVTPSFNQGRYLPEALASVLDQSYPLLDYHVIDGGSRDASRDIIAATPGLASWCSEPDGGLYPGLQKGFDRAGGEVLGWLNADDLHFPWTLRTVGEIFARFPEVEWLTSLAPSTWNARGHCLGFTSVTGFSRDSLLDGLHLGDAPHPLGWVPQEATFWRRSLWEKVGGRVPADHGIAGDFALWLNFARHAEPVCTPAPLARFRVHHSQLSHDQNTYLSEARRALVAARKSVAYAPSRLRAWSRASGLPAIPGLRGFFSKRLGYTARLVIAGADGEWKMETRRYL